MTNTKRFFATTLAVAIAVIAASGMTYAAPQAKVDINAASVEQLTELAVGDEEAVGLVVGAVDAHAAVVQKRPGDHDHLGVAGVKSVVPDRCRLDPALDRQP